MLLLWKKVWRILCQKNEKKKACKNECYCLLNWRLFCQIIICSDKPLLASRENVLMDPPPFIRENPLYRDQNVPYIRDGFWLSRGGIPYKMSLKSCHAYLNSCRRHIWFLNCIWYFIFYISTSYDSQSRAPVTCDNHVRWIAQWKRSKILI